jgi:hypothetical protein
VEELTIKFFKFMPGEYRGPPGAEEFQAPKTETPPPPDKGRETGGGRETEEIERAEEILKDIADRAREALGATVQELRKLEKEEAEMLQEIDELRQEAKRRGEKEREYSAGGLYSESNAEARRKGDFERKARKIEEGEDLKLLREKIDEAARDVRGVTDELFGLQRRVESPTPHRDIQRHIEKTPHRGR